MKLVIGVLLCVGAAFSINPSLPGDAKLRTFRCSPAHHVQFHWKTHVPAFTCKLGNEEFLLASSDLIQYGDTAFDIQVTSQAVIQGSPILHQPATILVGQRIVQPVPLVPARYKRYVGGGISGGSSSSSTIYQQHQQQHHQGGVIGLGPGVRPIGTGLGGIGSGIGGIGTGLGGVGTGLGTGLGVGVGAGVGFGVGAGFGR